MIELECEYGKNLILGRSGSQDPYLFDKQWKDYKNGFKSYPDFMLGLDEIHLLTANHGLTDLEIISTNLDKKFTNFLLGGEDVSISKDPASTGSVESADPPDILKL